MKPPFCRWQLKTVRNIDDSSWLDLVKWEEKEERSLQFAVVRSLQLKKLSVSYLMMQNSGIRIFLAHASGDKALVLELYEQLKAKGYKPWLDNKNLVPGQNWREVIPEAIKESELVIACLSKKSITQEGYIQQELRLALMEYVRKPANKIYIIPLRLEPCKIPNMRLPQLGTSLRDFHWLDYWKPNGFEQLERAIKHQYNYFVQPHSNSRQPASRKAESITPYSFSSGLERSRRYFLSFMTFMSVGTAGALLWEMARRFLWPYQESVDIVEEPDQNPILVSPRLYPENSPKSSIEYELLNFTFEIVTVNDNGEEITRHIGNATYFSENLGDGRTLDMVAIPKGSFLMGSPENEAPELRDEGPQHEVHISSFFMGKYPVTQDQWRAVTDLPSINLDLRPAPFYFKGIKRPVEQVSWLEAVEFCDRLSRLTGRAYRLPSEAEWEYACRATTTTPFCFGETITTDLSNYRGTDQKEYGWSGSYGSGPKGKYRKETTEVGIFPANKFGLFDMHGNVKEWCHDYWHDNYDGAPIDGSSWRIKGEENTRVQRGGSWFYNPKRSRSAYRSRSKPDIRHNNMGFRVACSVPKPL